MSNYYGKRHNWVCVDCRRSVRRPQFEETDVLCPECGRLCQDAGSKRRIPSRADHRSWRQLAADLDRARPAEIDRLEQRLRATSSDEPFRDWRIRRLRLLREIETLRRPEPTPRSRPAPIVPRRGMERAVRAADEAEHS